MKYKVTLNWHGELHIFYTHSISRAKALANAIIKLAGKLGRSNYSVRQYFIGEKDNWKVKRR